MHYPSFYSVASNANCQALNVSQVLLLSNIGNINIRSPCRTTGHFLLLVFDDFESSLTTLSLVHLVFIMGSSPLDMSLKRVSAMDDNSF